MGYDLLHNLFNKFLLFLCERTEWGKVTSITMVLGVGRVLLEFIQLLLKKCDVCIFLYGLW